ncbi:hypothetical protein [Yoonia sp.]|uniref:hypothetical protein n=1 Tax=Yoonia sp. TaxID=2212373 RepID=UPI0032983194
MKTTKKRAMFKYDDVSKINGLPKFRTHSFYMMLPHLMPADDNDVMMSQERAVVRHLIEENDKLKERFENDQQYQSIVDIFTTYRVANSKNLYERYDVRFAAKWLKALVGKNATKLKALYEERPLPSGQTGGLNQLNFQHVIRYLLNPKLLAESVNDEKYNFEELEWPHIKKSIFEDFDPDGEMRNEVLARLKISLDLMKNHNQEVTTRLSGKQFDLWRSLYSVLYDSINGIGRIEQRSLMIELCMLLDPQVHRTTKKEEYTDRVRKLIRKTTMG